MNCSSCGANLPPGAGVCPRCGAATPYNVSSPGVSQYQPAVPAEPYSMPQPSNDPTYISSPYGPPPAQPILPTNYGSFSPAYDPSQPNPYSSQVNPYSTIVPQDPYSAPAPPQPPGYPGAYPPPAQPPKRKSRAGLIALIISIIVLVLVVSSVGIFYAIGRTAGTPITNTRATPAATAPTPTPTTQPTTPSKQSIDPTAASIITRAQMASAIDKNLNPTTLTNTFAVNEIIYVTFDLHTSGNPGYAISKWYANGSFAFASSVLAIQPDWVRGVFSAHYNKATNGSVELYYCTQPNCSDQKLATVVDFTVTGSTAHTRGQPDV